MERREEGLTRAALVGYNPMDLRVDTQGIGFGQIS